MKKNNFSNSNQDFQFPHKETLSFDPAAFDTLINSQGVELVHHRVMQCPVGLTDPDDQRRPHEDHEHCSGGFLYLPAGQVTAAFVGNAMQATLMDVGRLDGASVLIILPRFYDKLDPGNLDVELQPHPFDRFYLKEDSISVPHQQLVAAHITGQDRLNFDALKVVGPIIDSHNKKYYENVDFKVVQGQIHWIGNNRPGTDPKTNKGVVYSIRYLYKPYWYVQKLLHEVRVAQIVDKFTGERRIERFPQSALLQREYLFRNQLKDTRDLRASEPRIDLGPSDGQFGPR